MDLLSLSVVLILATAVTVQPEWEMQLRNLHNTFDYSGGLFGQTKLSKMIIRNYNSSCILKIDISK